MSLLFFDGFDGYDAAADLTNFGGWISQTAMAISSTVRVGSGKSIQINSGTNKQARYLMNPVQTAKTLFAGFAVNRSSGIATNVFALYNAALAVQIALNITAEGFLQALAGNRSTILATGTTALQNNTWYYVELKLLVANTGGIFDCRLNGASEFTFTGDTQQQSTDEVASVALENWQGATTILIDDFYLLNSDGTANNTYLGEQRCEIMTPTSDSTVAWARNTGASNFSAVDDAIGAPDDDTTYVSSSTSAQKDEYGLSDLTGVNAVAGVKLVTRAEKDDANPLSLKTGIKSGATDQQVVHALGVGYANFIDLFETSDGASTAFTPTTVNSLLSTLEIP